MSSDVSFRFDWSAERGEEEERRWDWTKILQPQTQRVGKFTFPKKASKINVFGDPRVPPDEG